MVPAPLVAQFDSLSSAAAAPLTVTINPQYPRPFDTITISPRSNLIDLAAARVVVSVDGEVIEDGSGSFSTSARVGAAGSRSVVRVTATDASGQTYAQEVVIRPADVSLIIDASSTAHPFYDGGALVAPEGRVRLVAVPDIRTAANTVVPPQSLVYTWKNGDRTLLAQSGIGRSVLDASAPVRHRDANITVTVSTQDKSIAASANVIVTPVDPIIVVYPTSPLLGPLYEQALRASYTMFGEEATFKAVPYFFREMPSLAWTVNGTSRGDTEDLTVRITEPGRGTARITVTGNGGNIFQNAEDAFSLSFGSERGLGIFGL